MTFRRGLRLLPVALSILPQITVCVSARAADQVPSGTTATMALPPDSPRWDLQGQAKAAEYQGRKCLLLDGGAAIVKDFEMRDGVIDVDIATPASRGFFGF